MSWACGGRCACTEAGRSLLERYRIAVTSPRRPERRGLTRLQKSGRRLLSGGLGLRCKVGRCRLCRFDLDKSGRSDRDLLFALLCLRGLRQRDGKHAVLEICLDFVGVDAVRNSERSLERTITALGEVIILFLFLLFVPLLALDRQRAVGEFDVDIALVHPRQLRRDLEGVFLFDDVDGRRLAPADLAAPQRLNVEHAAAERRAPGAQLEILEQAIDFPPQALERPPLARTISNSLFLSHRQFRCGFSHVASPYFAHDGKYPSNIASFDG